MRQTSTEKRLNGLLKVSNESQGQFKTPLLVFFKRCFTFEVCVGAAFVSAFLLFTITAGNLSEDNNFGNNRNQLDINGELREQAIGIGGSVFYDLSIPANTTVAILTKNASEGLDTRMDLFRPPNEIVDFNDNVAVDNDNSLLIFSTQVEERLILQVGTFEDSFAGTFDLIMPVIEEKLVLGQTFREEAVNVVFLSTISLIEGKTYEIFAFDVENVEFDGAIRVRDLEGNELLEVFQSTVGELDAEMVFTAPTTDLFVVEVRDILSENAFNVTLLVRETIPTPLILNSELQVQEFGQFPLLSTSSNIFEVNLEANIQYQFIIDLAIGNSFDFNQFGQVIGKFDENGNFLSSSVFQVSGIVDGVSFRVILKDDNKIALRGESNFEATFEEPDVNIDDNNETFYYYDLSLTNVNGTLTFIDLVFSEDVTILLDISRLHPDFTILPPDNEFIDDEVGSYSLSVVNDGPLNDAQIAENALLADEDNLFLECDVDQTKFTIDDGCESGILLFCRNDFFAPRLTEGATLQQFSDICGCVDFLCASLPNHEDISEQFEGLLDFMYGTFAAISILGLCLYLWSTFDLIIFGGICGWTKRGFGTWSICGFFFFFSTIFYISQIRLTFVIDTMKNIKRNFDLNRIVTPSTDLSYDYYNNYIYELLGFNVEEEYNAADAIFLNEESLNAIPNGQTFDDLRRKILLNKVAFMLIQVSAVVCFLDVSVIWIQASTATSLNRKDRKKRMNQFKIGVRVIEAIYALSLFSYAIYFIATDGDGYSVFNSVLVLLLSLLISVLYIIGRTRLKHLLVDTNRRSKMNGQENSWQKIRKVSTIVIAANFGIFVIQVYKLINITNFNQLVNANNDPTALSLFAFQDLCLFSGQLAIVWYLWGFYRDYRRSLFKTTLDPEEEENGENTAKQLVPAKQAVDVQIERPNNTVNDFTQPSEASFHMSSIRQSESFLFPSTNATASNAI